LGSKPYTFPAADAEPNHEDVQRGRQQGWLHRNNAPPWWTTCICSMPVYRYTLMSEFVCWPCHIRLQNMIFVTEAPIMQQSNSMWLEPCHQGSGRWSWHMTSTTILHARTISQKQWNCRSNVGKWTIEKFINHWTSQWFSME
jgi:carbohydrate-selective porin OprB